MTSNIQKVLLLAAFLALSVHFTYAQKFDKNDLFAKWQLDKYSDDESYYKVPKKEIGDYIHLKKDMTYESRSEGETSTGTWMLNTNGTYFELKDADGKKEKIYIHFSSSKTLVVMYDADEYRVWEVHYVSCK
ncbi:MAG: hypothetical protein AAGI07_12640 [Bacteroidota bacterium]